jgi:predicted metal-dependent phosphoesterase TrpH
MGSIIFKRPPIKKLAKEGFLGVDMHFHTQYSLDASSRIPAVIKKAKRKGIGLAITDHNAIKGVQAAFKEKKDVLIIPGIEVTCRNGNHVLVYFYSKGDLEEFFTKKLKPSMKNPFSTTLSPKALFDAAEDYSSVLCAPHPYAPGPFSVMKTGMSEGLQKRLDLVEGLNSFNFRKFNLAAVYWASRIGKSMTGGSDGHSTFELGKALTFTRGYTIDSVFKDILDEKALIVGKEDNLLLKTLMSVRKEGAFINRSKKEKAARALIKSQFRNEMHYLKERLTNGKVYQTFMRHGLK